MNDELKQKTDQLIKEASAIVNSEADCLEVPISAQPHERSRQFELSVEEKDSSSYELPRAEELALEAQVLGPVANLGTQARTRYLMAKVRVLEENKEKLHEELKRANDEDSKLSLRVQELETERTKLQRSAASSATQLERLKQCADEARSKVDTLTLEKTALEKELESIKRAHDQQSSTQRTVGLRLNRALEDADRQRREAESARSSANDTLETLRKQVNQLTTANRRLERQKQELITGFKKQMRLIDVLRKQKMLIEASRALKITEEEFLKALDWQSG